MIALDQINEFRKGFLPSGSPCCFVNRHDVKEKSEVILDVEGFQKRLENGERFFYYGEYHDESVWDAFSRIQDKGKLNLADIGCERGLYPAMALHVGFSDVTVFDVRLSDCNHPHIHSICQSLGPDTEWREEKFDIVTCFSTLEHCGLGRYGDKLDPWGDFNLVKGIKKILKPNGKLIVSFPIGRGVLYNNLHRVYSKFRLDNMLSGFKLLWNSKFPDKWWGAIRGAYQPVFVYQMDE